MKRRARYTKIKRKRLKLRMVIAIVILVVLLILIIIRSYTFSLCKNIQHTDGCCPLAFYSPINDLGDDKKCTKERI